jgi:hypothetical protein
MRRGGRQRGESGVTHQRETNAHTRGAPEETYTGAARLLTTVLLTRSFHR